MEDSIFNNMQAVKIIGIGISDLVKVSIQYVNLRCYKDHSGTNAANNQSHQLWSYLPERMSLSWQALAVV